MAPPKFDDLGKAGADLFKKGFEHGSVKVELKNKAEGVDFTVKGAHNIASQAINASIESNMKCPLGTGASLKKVFHTNGKVELEASKSDLIKGAGKTTITGSLSGLNSNFVPGKFKQNYAQGKVNVNFASTLSASPCLNLDAVLAMNNVNAGFAVGFDAGKMELKSKALAVSFAQNQLTATAKTTVNNDLNLILHNKLTSTHSMAAMVDYSSKGVNLAIAGKKSDCPHGSTQYKLDNNGVLSSAFVTKLDSGCELNFSANMDLTNLQSGGHKLGAMFKFNL